MTEPLATRRPPVHALLERAVLAAGALPDDHTDRQAVLHRVGLAASDAGIEEILHALLDALDSPAHRAHLLADAARRADRDGRLEQARALARDAADALDGPGRWRPVLPDWVGPDSARADACVVLISLGEDRAAATVAQPIRPGTIWHARCVAALAHLLPARDGWETVAEAVRAIPSAADRARAAHAILSTTSPRPRLGPEAACALSLIDAVTRDRTDDAEATLEGARVAARLARTLLDVPALTAAVDAWGRASALAHRLPDMDAGGVAVLCTITRDQARRVGSGPATVTWQSVLERIKTTPLPPDPPQPGPWAEVLSLALHHPSLSALLSGIIARHPAVPSAWAHALGRLHICAGRPERAVRVAEVLSAAADRHPEDHESRLLAGLLRAGAGASESGWDELLEAITAEGPKMVWLAGADGPRRYEQWAVEALLDGDGYALALLLARLATEPGLRATLLAHCLHHTPAGEDAAALAVEVSTAVTEARAAGDSLSIGEDLACLPRAAWEHGDAALAEHLLGQLIDELQDVSTPAWLDAMTHIYAMLDQLGGGGDDIATPVIAGWQSRLDAAEPDDAIELLLGWAGLV